ncbi:hypothetical protein [Gordonia phthalatica]|uniref:Uncharacterized protein n=1 Tax=Gordonia phthalatica TaxID=1136941 RepID=A0A0N9NBT9_9ACTN|nr:hypothetical protein [Gordonia phthalatica]ALG85904.1 hypothetical protein ACH46_17190 [Gordonia phthalatica]
MTSVTNRTHRRSLLRSIERGLEGLTLDQTTRIRRMRMRIEEMDREPIYDESISRSISRAMKRS